jgi:3-oxoacyl-[acyl-carrier-protein] synthase I
MSAPALAECAISGVAVLTAAGDSAAQTAAAVRAGVSGLTEHPFLELGPIDPEWDPTEPVATGLVPTVDPMIEGPERLMQLALPVLRRLVVDARLKRRDLPSTALLVALPEEDEAVARWGLDQSYVRALLDRAGLDGFAAIELDRSGHAGALRLLSTAGELLAAGRARRCIVLGVDSYLSADRIAALDRSFRLRSTRSPDGFLPGEAGAALLLEPLPLARPDRADEPPREPLAFVRAPSIALEPASIKGERVSSGAGLQQALEGALGSWPAATPVAWALCDLNGESYRAFEWAIVRTRLADRLSAIRRLWHPAEATGDIGAATAAVLLGIVAAAFQRGAAPAERALVFVGCDRGERAAVTVAKRPS